MIFHSKLRLSDGRTQHYINGSLDWYINNILIPIFNKQIVVFHKWQGEGEAIVNTSCILQVKLFKSKEKLTNEEGQMFKASKITEIKGLEECTTEILNQVKQSLAAENSKSIIEKSLSINKKQVFVVMMFGDPVLDSAYEGVIDPIVREFGFEPIRVDKIKDSGKISDQILGEYSRNCVSFFFFVGVYHLKDAFIRSSNLMHNCP